MSEVIDIYLKFNESILSYKTISDLVKKQIEDFIVNRFFFVITFRINLSYTI